MSGLWNDGTMSWVRFGVLLAAAASLHAASDRLGSDSVPLDSARVAGPLRAACQGTLARHLPPNGGNAEWACNSCPPETHSEKDSWSLTSAIFGHFTSPDSDDAILSTYGCVMHAAGPMGGSFLVSRRKDGGWQLVSYAMTLLTWECRKIQMSNRRDALICENGDSHQGAGETWYEMITAEHGKLDAHQILLLQDNVTSGHTTVIEQVADRFDLRATGEGHYELRLGVRSGRKVLNVEDLRRGHAGEEEKVPTTRYWLVFRFDGRSWLSGSKTSAAIAKIYSIQREF